MLTRFQTEWYADHIKWVDATLKIAAAESPENKAQLSAWFKAWRARATDALLPIAQQALGADAQTAMKAVTDQLDARAAKAGLAL